MAIIGIIAAIAIPGLLQARINANESATLADIRTLITANATYQTQTPTMLGFAPMPTCNDRPQQAACLGAGYMGPAFLDVVLGAGAAGAGEVKSGYARVIYAGGPVPSGGGEVAGYCYGATAFVQNRTAVRNFGGESSGTIGAVTVGGVDCSLSTPRSAPPSDKA